MDVGGGKKVIASGYRISFWGDVLKLTVIIAAKL